MQLALIIHRLLYVNAIIACRNIFISIDRVILVGGIALPQIGKPVIEVSKKFVFMTHLSFS